MRAVYEAHDLAVNGNVSVRTRARRNAPARRRVVAGAAGRSSRSTRGIAFSLPRRFRERTASGQREVRCAIASPRTFDLRQSVADGSH
jgi:hypothetical protein